MDAEQSIRQFLGDRPGSAELSEWRATLELRLEGLDAERKRTGATAAVDNKIAQLKRQIAALREEEAITQFIEDSVRVTLAMGAVTEGSGDDPNAGELEE